MKRFIAVLICAVLVLSAFPLLTYADDEYFSNEQIEYYKNLGLQGTTVNVYNWGEYISDGSEGSMDVVSEFERLTGCTVNYTNFESNENMYSKLTGGGVSYDVIVPSDYMIDRLIDEDMLLELDFDNIPNMKYINKEFQNLFYDPDQKYSVCYNVGTTVLIYNKNLVKEEPDSWSVLWDEQYKNKVLVFNNPRDAFAIGQAMLGQDFNSTSEQDWVECAELMAKQKDAVNPVYVMDEVFNLMESGEYAFATYYAGDYLLMLENNPDLGYCFPKEGVNAFYDAFCVPVCSKNKKGAEAFINFMQEPQVAFENAEYIYYRSPNITVEENEDSSFYQSDVIYADNLNTQYFKNLPQNIIELENNLWTQVKSGKLSEQNKEQEKRIYIECSVIGGLAVIVIIGKIILNSKKKKEQDLSDLYD
ncbi:MAG: spermidine/putrescine ABC transporter substrate-binding protein [Eubacteriales bacterium]|nr:spermidine/putrescine ABC transporter substrate-binding protein [Eubacteriales bacterium]